MAGLVQRPNCFDVIVVSKSACDQSWLLCASRPQWYGADPTTHGHWKNHLW